MIQYLDQDTSKNVCKPLLSIKSTKSSTCYRIKLNKHGNITIQMEKLTRQFLIRISIVLATNEMNLQKWDRYKFLFNNPIHRSVTKYSNHPNSQN